MRLGLRSVLAEAGCRVVVDGARDDLLNQLLFARSIDVILLDLDTPTCVRAAAHIAAQHRVVVIACSADQRVMRVFAATEAASDQELTVAALAGAVTQGPR